MTPPIHPFQQDKTLVKICGLRTQTDVDAAAGCESHGTPAADFCGFIFHPASPRHVTAQAAANLDSHGLLRVGVFVEQNAQIILQTARLARLDYIQLHGEQSRELARQLQQHLPQQCDKAVQLIRVVWPARYPDRRALEADMDRHADETALFLLDAGLSGGGSGTLLPWERLAGLHSPRPWLLAGGLNPENVLQALQLATVLGNGPCGADLNSGLESAPGRKDPTRVRMALNRVKRGSHFPADSAQPTRVPEGEAPWPPVGA